MRRSILSTLVLLSLIFNKAYSHSFVCDTLMSSPSEINTYGESDLDETDRFIVYLESLLEEGVLEDDHLSSFILELEEGRVLNPFKDQGGSAAAIQGKGVQGFIDKDEINKDRLLEWARRRLREREGVQVKRHKTRNETRSIHQKIEFHPVQVGSFQVTEWGNKVAINLTHPIEVMSTPVTQKHWVELMGRNPSQFKEGEHSMDVFVDGKFVQLQPNHPVEKINWWSALIFANRLSEKHGLQPAYDLRGIEWIQDNTTAENGNLRGRGGEIKIYANGGVHDPYDGDIYYQAEGYRLPTEAEQEFLLRAGGASNGTYHFGNSEEELKDYAWFRDNSGKKTHPVAKLKPLILDGKEFYDLHGNVFEWSWNWFDDLQQFGRGGDNPVGPKYGSSRGLRGGSWITQPLGLGSSATYGEEPNNSEKYMGFRLVRTIKNPKGKGLR